MAEIIAHKNVYVALTVAQTEMGKVVKGAMNPAFKSRYADLADVVAAVLPALNGSGISYLSHGVDGAWRTVLVHGESDTRVECDVPLLVNKQDMQSLKSAITYAKRIGLESLTGVAPEDDDGNAAAKAPPAVFESARSTPRDPAPAVSNHLTEGQFRELRDLIDRSGADMSAFLRHFGAGALPQVPADRFAEAKALLNRKLADKPAPAATSAPAPALDDEIPY